MMLLTVLSKTADPDILKEKYSASFVNELSRQITEEISRAMSVEGLDESTLELQLVFEPGTYMEHTSENVTYRRLMITDKLCQPRDFWVKWTRLDGAVAYTVSDEVTADTIKFEIGEDVPQKIREKEFRFLCFSDPDKYQSSMSKKTATEWRELIKRSVKRGDLTKIEIESTLSDDNGDVNDELARVLGISAMPKRTEEPETPEGFDKVMEMARAAIADYNSVDDEADGEISYAPPTEPDFADKAFEDTEVQLEDAPEAEIEEETEAEAEDEYTEEPAPFSLDGDIPEEDEAEEEEADETPCEAVLCEAAEECEPCDENNEDDEMIYNEEVAKLVEERMRAEIEAKIRLEYEERARAKVEEEARQLRLENERLAEAARLAIEEKERYERERREAEERQKKETLERERLEEAARQAEEDRARRERELLEAEEMRKKEEALRIEIEERMRKEALERERLAEAARQAEIESARLEREKREAEERHRKEEEELRAKIEAQMQREAIERDRLAEAARQAVEEQRRRELEEAERKAAQEAPAAKPVEPPKPAPAPKPKAPDTFTSHATLTFRKPVDMSVINKIQSIVEETLIANDKADVPMHLKAFQMDETTVGLDIIRLPIKEKDLIVVIMKALGNGHIGISKITVE